MLAVSTRAGPSRLSYSLNNLSAPRAAATSPNHERPSSAGTARVFSSSVAHSGHYETLGVPKGASKAQIKAAWYQMSKKFHPDINDTPEATAKFQAGADAYAVLADDRQRRAYDRVFDAPPAGSHGRHFGGGMGPGARDPGEWAFESRRRTGTGAYWAGRTRAGPSAGADAGEGGHGHGRHYDPGRTHPAYDRTRYDPQRDPWRDSFNVRRATGTKYAPGDSPEEIEAELARQESGIWRVGRVILLVLAIAGLGGGLTANAS